MGLVAMMRLIVTRAMSLGMAPTALEGLQRLQQEFAKTRQQYVALATKMESDVKRLVDTVSQIGGSLNKLVENVRGLNERVAKLEEAREKRFATARIVTSVPGPVRPTVAAPNSVKLPQEEEDAEVPEA